MTAANLPDLAAAYAEERLRRLKAKTDFINANRYWARCLADPWAGAVYTVCRMKLINTNVASIRAAVEEIDASTNPVELVRRELAGEAASRLPGEHRLRCILVAWLERGEYTQPSPEELIDLHIALDWGIEHIKNNTPFHTVIP